MGFKQVVTEHQQQRSQALAAQALDIASSSSQLSLQMQQNIERADPLLRPIFERYVHEALELDYAADTSEVFRQEGRATWSFRFVPSAGEAPYREHISGMHNEARAFVRIYADNHCTLEWAPPSNFYSETFSRDALQRTIPIAELSAQAVESWLDEFVKTMIERRERQDAKRSAGDRR
ncbi:hypothetical protein RQP54_18135 [Curvibacter sp. APW13]|uniref:hypothetical protein n=1 Tax=Curvibacter sp. APW13 TaxID=3077236 RepID=UPI0028DD737E|nr:hypothetical protein [Curvibacter sp. APW13]MDT8992798.1 hypothetical protein [Curvibacter sp. APW13]